MKSFKESDELGPRTYETLCLTKVDMPEENFNAMVERVRGIVAREGSGEWLYSDDWGKSKIAYFIGKDQRARWTYFRYKSQPQGVDEINRTLKLNENVLRQLTCRAAPDGSDYDKLRPNMSNDLVDRERVRDWREDRSNSRGRFGGGRGGGRGYGGRDGGGSDARRSEPGSDWNSEGGEE